MSAHSRSVTAAAPTSVPAKVLAVVVLAAPGVLGFYAAFGTVRPLLAGAAGVLLGAGIGWGSAVRRWSALSTAAVTVVICALAAGPAALPDTTVSGVLPTAATGRALAAGVIRCWRDLVTATAPTGVLGDLLLVPYLTGLIGGVLGVVLALRVRRPAWALLPTGAILVVSVLVGTDQPVSLLLEGGVFAVLAVLWVAVTAQAWAAPNIPRAAAGLALLAVAVVAGSFAGPALTAFAGPRFVLRNTVTPPFDIRAYQSPLNGFRKFVKDESDTPLMTASGVPSGARIRLATMDTFDGTVWNVAGGPGGVTGSSGSFRRLPVDTSAHAADVTVHVQVQGYSGVWLPDVGDLRSVTFTGPRAAALQDSFRYNAATRTGIVSLGLQDGDGYTLRAGRSTPPGAQALDGRRAAAVALPEPVNVPEVVAGVAADSAAKAQGDYARATAIADSLRKKGFFSDGLTGQVTSRAGHGSGRLAELLGSQVWVGDAEQYAAAAGLMARQLQLPARVVMGFDVPGGSTPVIRGAQVTAWIEVAFEGVGWVPFQVTPDKNRKPPVKAPAPAPKPRQVTQQPPPPAEQPPPPLPATGNDRGQQQKHAASGLPGWLVAALTVAAWVGGPLLLVALVVAVIVGVKLRRRRIRRRAGSTEQRVAAGWWEVLDAHRDHGAALPPSGTRREIAGVLERPATMELAERADDAVFAGGVVTEDQASTFWQLVDRELADLSAAGARARWKARLSLRSFRGRRS